MAFSWCCLLSVHLEETSFFQSTSLLNFLFPTPTPIPTPPPLCSTLSNSPFLESWKNKLFQMVFFFLGFPQDLFSPTFCTMVLLFLSHHNHDFLLLISPAGFHYYPCGGSCVLYQRDSLSKNVQSCCYPCCIYWPVSFCYSVSLIYSWLTEH